MKQKQLFSGIAAAFAIAILIFDSKTALVCAAEGVDLCLRTILPSLLPFFFLSGILVSSFTGCSLTLLRPLGKLLGMPPGTESLLISGFLGGYPIGAAAVREAWQQDKLKKEDGERLLSFCNNAGPAFLFGMTANLFSNPAAGWILWCIQILSALITGFLFRKEPADSRFTANTKGKSLPDALSSALYATAQVCGWVILFRVLCGFFRRWFLWCIPGWDQVFLCGILELANGILESGTIPSENIRFVLCSVMLSFGGLCVLLQTYSAARGLKLRYYIRGKLCQSAISLLLSLLYLRIVSPVWFLFLPILLVLQKKSGKRGSIPRPVGV